LDFLRVVGVVLRFSALQRAENSSIYYTGNTPLFRTCFSALQRAENSSIHYAAAFRRRYVLFQCSSASRKFLNNGERGYFGRRADVSVLFSEPKIPQYMSWDGSLVGDLSFSALQRAENSSIAVVVTPLRRAVAFQCSSASRKFLNL